MVQATWSPIHDIRGGCPYVPDYYFSFFNNTALINFFFLFLWQQTEINNMLNLVVANQQRNDLTAQQVLPPIIEGLTWLKLSMEANISSILLRGWQLSGDDKGAKEDSRKPILKPTRPPLHNVDNAEMMMPDHPPLHNTICTALPKLGRQHLPVMSQPPLVSIIQLMSTSTAWIYINKLDHRLP